MIKVYIPKDKEFNYNDCKKLYTKYRRYINDIEDFKKIVLNTFFYSFYDDDKFLGCIYYYTKDNKLFVNAYASRKHHQKNIECLKMTFNWFNCDIYAETVHKTAIYCLLECGFNKIGKNIYRKEK